MLPETLAVKRPASPPLGKLSEMQRGRYGGESAGGMRLSELRKSKKT